MGRSPNRRTQATWATYRKSIGDRSSLFAAIRNAWVPATALYPGSYLDLSPSTAISSVTYVDTDRRAARFFADTALVTDELLEHGALGARIEFLHLDYTSVLPLALGSFDLLISLYAGPVWDAGSRFLAPGGLLLANNSHGDASLAALDPRLRLLAAVHVDGDRYRLDRSDLDRYLVPKIPAHANPDRIRSQGRGIGFKQTAFAYVFRFDDSGG